jgi:hypothetical protein
MTEPVQSPVQPPACRKAALETFAVDPARLAHGRWCHRAEKTIGQGDIAASYSADKIGMNEPVRRPFRWRGADWLCVGSGPYNGRPSAEAYRLVHPKAFDGIPTTYREKLCDADAARADPLGFYHGMAVRRGGETFVLCGPPALFVEGETEQRDLFGDL